MAAALHEPERVRDAMLLHQPVERPVRLGEAVLVLGAGVEVDRQLPRPSRWAWRSGTSTAARTAAARRWRIGVGNGGRAVCPAAPAPTRAARPGSGRPDCRAHSRTTVAAA